jgi:hypothetical protein
MNVDSEYGASIARRPYRAVRPRESAAFGRRLYTIAMGLSFLVVAERSALAEPVADCGDKAKQGFSERFVSTYKEHLAWNGADPNAPAAKYRGAPVVIESPPYPFTNWPLGGTENIGYENMYYGALMDTIYCGENGQAWKDSRFTIYGWIEPGMNISTSKSRYNFVSATGGNYPAAYSYQPNTVQVDQAAFYLERTPDEVQTDHIDWGFRFTGLYGTDYKYTFAHKVDPASRQYERHANYYGFDPVMAYAELYVPQVAEGLNIRVGRYISIPDIEAQLAPNNYTYSHSLLYTYDPYTQAGVVATIKLNRNWLVQGEFSAGNDIAFWDKQDRQFTPAVCAAWTSDSGEDNIYPCINGLNNGKFAWNNIQHLVATWYHKFNDKWHMDNEVWYMWQKDVPNANNLDPNVGGAAQIAARFPNTTFNAPFGALCSDPNVLTCKAGEYAFVNYLEYQIGPRDAITIRNEIFNDLQGQRTGFKTLYSEHLLGWAHWFGDTITVRPELRFEKSYSAKAYDNPSGTIYGGKNHQLMLAIDAIFHF